MASYYRRIIRPVINEFLNSIPGKKRLSEYLRVVSHLLKPNGVIYPDVVVVMTTHCSLKCAKCNNLMCMYEKPYHIPADQLIKDIMTLLKNTDTCVKLQLLGGEPFVYPELLKVLKAIKDHPKVLCTAITTNGTIIPNEEILEEFSSFSRKKIVISDYGVKTQKVDELMQVLKRHSIPFHRAHATVWLDPGGTECRNKDIGQLIKEFNGCYSSRYCRTLLNGKLFLCARSAHLADLGYMDGTHDSFDIRQKRSNTEFRREIRDFFLKDYAEGCNHCDHALKRKIKAGEQAL